MPFSEVFIILLGGISLITLITKINNSNVFQRHRVTTFLCRNLGLKLALGHAHN